MMLEIAIILVIFIMACLSFFCYYTAWILLDAFLEKVESEKDTKKQS